MNRVRFYTNIPGWFSNPMKQHIYFFFQITFIDLLVQKSIIKIKIKIIDAHTDEYLFIEILRTSIYANIEVNKLEPPEERKGRGTPVMGISPIVIPIFKMD